MREAPWHPINKEGGVKPPHSKALHAGIFITAAGGGACYARPFKRNLDKPEALRPRCAGFLQNNSAAAAVGFTRSARPKRDSSLSLPLSAAKGSE